MSTINYEEDIAGIAQWMECGDNWAEMYGNEIIELKEKIDNDELEFWKQFINYVLSSEMWEIKQILEIAQIFVDPDISDTHLETALINMVFKPKG